MSTHTHRHRQRETRRNAFAELHITRRGGRLTSSCFESSCLAFSRVSKHSPTVATLPSRKPSKASQFLAICLVCCLCLCLFGLARLCPLSHSTDNLQCHHSMVNTCLFWRCFVFHSFVRRSPFPFSLFPFSSFSVNVGGWIPRTHVFGLLRCSPPLRECWLERPHVWVCIWEGRRERKAARRT